MGKYNYRHIEEQGRVIEAELKQPLRKDQDDIPAHERLLRVALQRRAPKKDIEPFGQKIVLAQRRVACFQKLVDAIVAIRNQAAMLCEAAVKNKTPPSDVFAGFQALFCAADTLGSRSLRDFRIKVGYGLYGKTTVDRIAKRDELEEDVRKVIASEPISKDEIHAAFVAFCQKYPDLQPQLEATLGVSFAPPEEVLEVPTNFPGVPPGQPAFPAPQQGFPPPQQGFPPTQPSPPGQVIQSLLVPISFAPFPREQWAALAEQVYRAAV
jgi:hypothetical protein